MPNIQLLRWIAELISPLIDGRFYGSLTLKFESGKLVCVKKEESIKPPTGKE